MDPACGHSVRLCPRCGGDLVVRKGPYGHSLDQANICSYLRPMTSETLKSGTTTYLYFDEAGNTSRCSRSSTTV